MKLYDQNFGLGKLLNGSLLGLFMLYSTVVAAQSSATTPAKPAKRDPRYNLESIKKLQKPGTGLKIQTRPDTVPTSTVKVQAAKLRQAISAYRSGDIDGAMSQLDAVLMVPGLSKRDRGIAQFFMGKALFRKGLVYAAVPFFHEVVKNHPRELFYLYSFRRLVWIAKRDRKYDVLTSVLRAKKSVRVPRNHRNDVYYMLAKDYFNAEEYKRTLWVIENIQPGSAHYHQALLIKALILVNTKQADAAIEVFNLASQSPDEDERGLAFLGLGRIYYNQGKDKLAVVNYSRISKSSRYWLAAQVEAAWAYFRSNEPSRALGKVHPFDTEPFGGVFSPEASILKSTVFFRLCKYQQAELAINTFFERYLPVYRQIETFNGKYRQNRQRHRGQTLKAIFGSSTELPKLLTQEIFSRTWFEDRLNQARSLRAEEGRLAKLGSLAKTASINRARAYVVDSRKRLNDTLADRAAPLLLQWQQRLDRFFRQASLLRFESAYAMIDFEKQKVTSDFEIPRDPEFEVWEFDEEYWRDELGGYRYLLRSECREQG